MNRKFLRRVGLPLGIALLLAACASNQPAPVVDMSMPSNSPAASAAAPAVASGSYRVVRGDTLYAIAFKHGLDYRDLAAWNGVAAPYKIFVGQELHLSAPARTEPATTAPVAVAAKSTESLPEPAPGAAVTTGISGRPPVATTAPAFEDVPPQSAAPAPEPPKAVEPPVAAAPVPAIAPPKPTELQKPVSPPPAPVAAATPPSKPAPPPKPSEPARADNAPELVSGGVAWRWPSEGKVIGAYVSGEPTKQGIDIGGKSGDPVRAAADGEVVYSGNGLIGYGELIIVKHNANFLSAYGHNRARLVKEGDKVKAGQAIAEMGASASSRDELHFEIRKNGKPVNPLEYLPAR